MVGHTENLRFAAASTRSKNSFDFVALSIARRFEGLRFRPLAVPLFLVEPTVIVLSIVRTEELRSGLEEDFRLEEPFLLFVSMQIDN